MGGLSRERSLLAVAVVVSLIMVTVSSGCLSLDLDDGESELGGVDGLTASNNSVYIELRWEELESADYYRVYRNGDLLSETNMTNYVDGFVERHVAYSYQVSGVKKEHDMFEGVEGEISSPVEATITAPDYEQGFAIFFTDSMIVINSLLSDMGRAGQALDYHQVGELAMRLEFFSSRYLNESDHYRLQGNGAIREEYQEAMNDFNSAGEYFGMAAGSFNYNYIETGEEYVQSGYDHADHVSQMIY